MNTYKIVVMSDSHGRPGQIKKILKKQPLADKYIFLGDGVGNYYNEKHDVDTVLEEFPKYRDKFICVRGNCDDDKNIPPFMEIAVPKHKIFATHGHKYGVYYGCDGLKDIAGHLGCDIILHGHTHIRSLQFSDGFYIMNPGSCGEPRDGKKPSFGLIEILENGDVLANIADI